MVHLRSLEYVVRQQVFEWQYVSSYIGCQVLAGAIASRVTLSGSTHQPPSARIGGDTHAHRGVGRHAFRSDHGESGSGHHPSRSVLGIYLDLVDDDQLRRMRRAMAQMLWSAACRCRRRALSARSGLPFSRDRWMRKCWRRPNLPLSIRKWGLTSWNSMMR